VTEPAFVVALPTADRQVAFAFYRDGLGLEAIGPVADDGVPEPLQLVLRPGAHLMLIPTGGFGWVTAGRARAAPGTSECLLCVTTGTDAEVDALIARAAAAGGEVVTAPEAQPWGYAGTVADPDGHLWMVQSRPFGD
jgi:predicted lactoylglutathione lyase